MYEKLIEALRMGADYGVEEESVGKLCADAAAAIEALEAELDKYHELCDVDEIPEVLEILMTV